MQMLHIIEQGLSLLEDLTEILELVFGLFEFGFVLLELEYGHLLDSPSQLYRLPQRR